jgi:hypothetical protein
MGYILHLIDAPDVTDADAAEEFIDGQRDLPPAADGKFAAFVKDITQTYPDLSEEDEDGDNDENLWEEGIVDAASYGKVKELVVKEEVTDEAVVAALVAAAVKNGLKLYDAEGQVVYPE